MVLDAIQVGRVRELRDVPYDPAAWDEAAVRDWLERTHRPRRARQIVSELRRGQHVKSRPIAPTVFIAIEQLIARVEHPEHELAALKRAVPERS